LPGFVEPVPEFYRELGLLCERFEQVLNRTDTFAEDQKAIRGDEKTLLGREERGALLEMTDELIGMLEKGQVEKRGVEGFKDLPEDWERTLRRAGLLAEFRGIGESRADPLSKSKLAGLKRPEEFKAYLDGLRKERDEHAREIDEGDVRLAGRWQALRECCFRLECLSHKQLRGREFAGDEKAFLKRYGATLARTMFYDGNSYSHPRDDAPRVVEVFARRGEFLEVGIGRPRALYVLYPWQGKEVLCRGAVLPYHEFVHGERLTDANWRELLSTPGKTAAPAWAKVLTDGAER
jgi:hypothetical protein